MKGNVSHIKTECGKNRTYLSGERIGDQVQELVCTAFPLLLFPDVHVGNACRGYDSKESATNNSHDSLLGVADKKRKRKATTKESQTPSTISSRYERVGITPDLFVGTTL
jgi:hypothetical protein